MSEEFYDTLQDFDNVHNLIDRPQHQQRIVRMREALRQKQLELHDSGLLPESMREQRAARNNMTIYEMVRHAELYPLASYLDAADRALARDPRYLATFVRELVDADSGIRYWAVVGLHLLEEAGRPAIGQLENALADESDEVKMMAAWTLVKLGRKESGLGCLRTLLHNGTTAKRKLLNILDWMGADAVPLVTEYLQSHPQEAKNILAKIAQDQGIAVRR